MISDARNFFLDTVTNQFFSGNFFLNTVTKHFLFLDALILIFAQKKKITCCKIEILCQEKISCEIKKRFVTILKKFCLQKTFL